MSRQRILITSVVAVVAFLSGGWFMQQGSGSGESVYQRARLFDDVLTHVADYYVDSLDQRQLYRMAIDGMLRTLDPHSIFLPEKRAQQMDEQFHGEYSGIGVQFDIIDNKIVVSQPPTRGDRAPAGLAVAAHGAAVPEQQVAGGGGHDRPRAEDDLGRPLLDRGLDVPGRNDLVRAQIHALHRLTCPRGSGASCAGGRKSTRSTSSEQ